MEEVTKILLLGRHSAGKSSMARVIFHGDDRSKLLREPVLPTRGVESSTRKIAGKFPFEFWDCGGQDTYFNSMLGDRSRETFINVKILVFVFNLDRRNLKEIEEDMEQFKQTILKATEYSKDFELVVLINKADVLTVEMERNFAQKNYSESLEAVFKETGLTPKFVMYTTIRDESVFLAWNKIIKAVVKKPKELNDHLAELMQATWSYGGSIHEKSTGLELATHATMKDFSPVKDKVAYERSSLDYIVHACTESVGRRHLGTEVEEPEESVKQRLLKFIPVRNDARVWLIFSLTPKTVLRLETDRKHVLVPAIKEYFEEVVRQFSPGLIQKLGLGDED